MDKQNHAWPRTIDECAAALGTALAEYENAAYETVSAISQHAEVDVEGSRVRRAAVKRLIAGGMSPTMADKSASDDDVYAGHKDSVMELAMFKAEKETERDVAHERVKALRVLLYALTVASQDKRDESVALAHLAAL